MKFWDRIIFQGYKKKWFDAKISLVHVGGLLWKLFIYLLRHGKLVKGEKKSKMDFIVLEGRLYDQVLEKK